MYYSHVLKIIGILLADIKTYMVKLFFSKAASRRLKTYKFEINKAILTLSCFLNN